jgi:quinol monooxygenase YgiN
MQRLAASFPDPANKRFSQRSTTPLTRKFIMSRFSISVELKAKPGKEEAVAAFIAEAQPLVAAETGTLAWFGIRIDTNTFAFFDTFDTQAARQAHMDGPIAKALLSRADELLSAPPKISFGEVLAEKLPS